MKAKLVKESLTEGVASYDKEARMRHATKTLNAEGYNVDMGWNETHVGIDHWVITDRRYGNIELAWLEKGSMRSISDSDDWGWCITDNENGNLVSFENDFESALDTYKQMYDEVYRR